MRGFDSKLILKGSSNRFAESIVAEASATNRLRLVSVRYMSMNMATVDLASSRLQESTSYHSSLAMTLRMALMWKGANSYLA